jgi:hypothetical protein
VWLIVAFFTTKELSASREAVIKLTVQFEDPKITGIKNEHAQRINDYFATRNMPLAGYGQLFVEEAEKNGIDWRLLPAIGVKESSGGKFVCSDGVNAFGWASCKIKFTSIEEAIKVVSKNLGGNNPSTSRYYSGDTYSKLYSYNGTVEALYPSRVLAIMEQF